MEAASNREGAVTGTRRIRVALFQRRRRPGETYSVERLFDAVVPCLPPDRYEVRRLICPFESKGLLRRVLLIVWAAFHQGDVNHITGDVNFLGLLMRRSRTLLTILDSRSMQRLSGWKRWIYGLIWLELPIRRAGRVTAISEATLAETLSLVRAAPSKFAVVPCCVPEGLARTPQQFRQSEPRFLIVGTKPNKNVPRIIEALASLPCRLVVIGELTEMQRKLAALHGIDIENHVDLDDAAMARQYRDADAVLFISTYEGFGLPILEAQLVGRPVITSRRSPMQEVAGDVACLVDPESVTEIRAAIVRVMRDADYRATLVSAGFDNVESYSPKAVARRYADEYEKLYLLSGT